MTSSPIPFTPTFEVAGIFPDLILLTADQVCLYAHRRKLLHASTNGFGGLLAGAVSSGLLSIDIPELSLTMTLCLHVIYAHPYTDLAPSLHAVEDALAALGKYGVSLHPLAGPYSPLFNLVLSHAPYRPIKTYALAAHYELEELAVAASSHLLAYDTSTLSDELTLKMGPVYFKRLFDLHQTRLAALKAIVLKPPRPHPPTAACKDEAQMEMAKMWAFAAAELVWNALPSISTYTLQTTFDRAGNRFTCQDCQLMLQIRTQEVVQEWSAVKTTI